MFLRTLWVLISIFLLNSFSLSGQQPENVGVLTGRVVDSANRPVAGARVRVVQTGAVAFTDDDGRFNITSLPLLKLDVTVTARGYRSGLKTQADLTSQTESSVEFVMDQDQVLEQSVVVTGSGTQELLVDAPVRTELISPTFVKEQVVRTLSEALVASVPGIRIENNCQNCGFSAIRMNGLEGPYTQILEDGLPTVSGASMVYALDQLPVEFFESIEVVKGGASSLYGPNAVAGVVNMIRREPKENLFQIDVQQGWNYGRPERTAGAIAQIENLGKGWQADFYYRGFGRTHLDIDRDGFTEVARRSSHSGGGTLFRRFLDGKARMTIGGSTIDEFRRGGDHMNRLPEQTFITEQLISARSAGFVRWNHSLNPNFYYNLSSSLSHLSRASYYGANFDPNAYGNTRNPLSITDASLGYQAGRHSISSGYQYWFEHVADAYPGYNRDIRQSFKNSGFYLQDEWRISPRIVLLAGGRVDKSNLLKNAVFSPRGNVRIGLTKSLNLRAGISTGFRAPQVFDEDLHVSSVGGSVMLIQRAANLKHESSRSFSVALDYTSTVKGNPFQMGTSFFWTRLDDVFLLRETQNEIDGNRIFERTNGPGSRFRGIEANMSIAAASWLRLRGGWTFQQARYDRPEPVFGSLRYFRTPNSYGFGGADFDLPWKVQWINTLDFTGPMQVQHFAGYIPADRVDFSPWFQVWNTVLSREFPLGRTHGDHDHRKLRVYVRGTNLTNSFQKNFDQGPLRDSKFIYGPMLPRGVVTGMTMTF